MHLLFVNCNLICHAISRFLVGTWNSPESGVDSLMHLYICFSYIVDVLMCLSIWLFSCFCCSCLFVCLFFHFDFCLLLFKMLVSGSPIVTHKNKRLQTQDRLDAPSHFSSLLYDFCERVAQTSPSNYSMR